MKARGWFAGARIRRGACGDWETLASRAAVLDLPAEAGRALAAHVASCARCGAHARREERLTRLLAGLPLPAWPIERPILPPAAAAVAAQAGGDPSMPASGAALAADRARRALRLAPIPTLALVLLILALLSIFRRPAHPTWRLALVSPAGAVTPAWSLAMIGASVEPPLLGESLHLLVDGRDVTAASDVTPDFVLYTTSDPLPPGEHLVAVEVRDRNGAPIDEQLWVVTSEPERMVR